MNWFYTFSISLIFSLLSVLIFKHDKNKKLLLLGAIIIFIGCFIRLYRIELFPIGLNQDEASIGYETYSLMNYGIDRNGMSWPVHFISWGSGQNTLYAYMMMPFMKFISDDNLVIRLPMSLIGCITLLVLYVFIRKHVSEKNQLVILLLIAIMPWHIMKSRWGLESNIFPDLVIYASILLYEGINLKKRYLLYISAIIFGISTYAYGTSYFFVPVFLVLLYGYLISKKKITVTTAFTLVWVNTLVSLPMIMFVIINYFDFNTVNIFKITIPKLYYNRVMGVTSLGEGHTALVNAERMFRLIFTQHDGGFLNHTQKYGIFYYVSFPFLIYGIFVYFKKYRKYDYLNIILILTIAALLTGFIVVGNINRLNILWLPLFAFAILGVIDVINRNKYVKIIIIGIYLIHFGCFCSDYFGKYQETLAAVDNYGLKESILSVRDTGNIFITNEINQPYIFWLYYNKISPYDYIRDQGIFYKYVMFQQVLSIGRVRFFMPHDMIFTEGNTYIIYRNAINYYEHDGCKVTYNEAFAMVEC